MTRTRRTRMRPRNGASVRSDSPSEGTLGGDTAGPVPRPRRPRQARDIDAPTLALLERIHRVLGENRR